MYVEEVMNKAVSVEHDITIKDAAKIMSKKNIGSVVVIKNDYVMGIVTDTDVVKNVSNLNKRISSLMSNKTLTVFEEDDLRDAVKVMNKNKLKRIPVINKAGRLVGIVSSTDIIAHANGLNDDFFLD